MKKLLRFFVGIFVGYGVVFALFFGHVEISEHFFPEKRRGESIPTLLYFLIGSVIFYKIAFGGQNKNDK